MLQQLGNILWIALLVRSSFAAKVRGNKGSVSAGDHTFSNSPSEAFAQAFEAFAHSSQSTTLQVKGVGIGNEARIHDGAFKGKEPLAAQMHSNHVPFLALKEETPRTPLVRLMNVSLDKWGHKVNCNTESFDKLANRPFGQAVKSSPLEKTDLSQVPFDKFASAQSFNAWQLVELFMRSLDQHSTLIRLVLPLVLFAFAVTLSCSRSTKPKRDSGKACARTEEDWRKRSGEKLSADYSSTTPVSSGTMKMYLDVSCVDDNVEHFDMGQETDDDPDDICRACAERAPDMCRTCAESFEEGATLPEKLQAEAMPPLRILASVEHPGNGTRTPGIAAAFPELHLSSSDTEKSQGEVGGDGCEPTVDPLKAESPRSRRLREDSDPLRVDHVWVGKPTLDLFMETLGWGRAPRASSSRWKPDALPETKDV